MTDTPALPEPVASFVDAVNRGDEDAFLGAFVEGGFVDDWGRVFSGRGEIKTWSDDEFLGADGTLTPEEVTVDGDTVTVVGDWASTHANGRSSFAIDLVGDQVGSMTIRGAD